MSFEEAFRECTKQAVKDQEEAISQPVAAFPGWLPPAANKQIDSITLHTEHYRRLVEWLNESHEMLRAAECELNLAAENLKAHGDNYSAENKDKCAGRIYRLLKKHGVIRE